MKMRWRGVTTMHYSLRAVMFVFLVLAAPTMPMDADHPGLNRAFAAAAKLGLPVNLLCWGILDKGVPHIQRHRDTVIVIDHLGLLQPARPPVPADVWAD